MQTNLPRRAYSVDEVATMYGCCRQTIYNEINKGSLPSTKIGDRRLITPGDLDLWDEVRANNKTLSAQGS